MSYQNHKQYIAKYLGWTQLDNYGVLLNISNINQKIRICLPMTYEHLNPHKHSTHMKCEMFLQQSLADISIITFLSWKI